MEAEPILLDADPSGDAPMPFQGYLDVVDARLGIKGWALSREARQRPVTVELLAGGECIARQTTSQPRPDVSLEQGGTCTPGFQFDVQELHLLPLIAEARPDAKLSARVAGSDFTLRAGRPMPTVREFLLGDAPEGQAAPSTAPAQSARPPLKDLPSALAFLRRAAEPLAGQALPARSGASIGFIEAVSTEMAGLLWFLGWIKGEDRFALSGVMADHGKHPAGLLFATYPRPDLPEGAVGMIGVMLTNWRSRDPKEVAILHCGEDGTQQLRTNVPLVELRLQDWMARFNKLRPQLLSPVAPELRRLLGLISNWVPGNASTLDVTIEQGMDRVLVLPGFGALAEGWVLSPARQPEALMLRLGDRILEADPVATFFKPRPDLANKLPGGGRLAEAAGFVAAFRGNVSAKDMTRPIIKFVFSGGLSTNHELDARILRTLGHPEQLEDVLAFYREPAAERFFPAFSRAVAASLHPGLRHLTAFALADAERALVWALPDDRSEIQLAFAEMTGMLRRGLVPGIAILAEPGNQRALVMSLFRALAKRGEAACSLFFLPRTAHAPYVLKGALDLLGAERFAFIGPGLHPDAMAGEALGAALRCAGPVPAFALPIRSGIEAQPGPRHSTRRHSTRRSLPRQPARSGPWLKDMPVRISGLASGHLRLPIPVAIDKGRVLRSWSVEPSRLSDAVDEALAETPQMTEALGSRRLGRIAVVSHQHPCVSKGGAENSAYALFKGLLQLGEDAIFVAACDRRDRTRLCLDSDHEFAVFHDGASYDHLFQVARPEVPRISGTSCARKGRTSLTFNTGNS
jgi:hypothetical protein